MLELEPEKYACVAHLFKAEHVGSEVSGMVLSGNSLGKVFVNAQNDFRAAFVYDNGFCVLAGSVPNPGFASECLQWLYDYPHQDFFILYPSHESWLPCLDLAKSSSTQRSRRVAFQLDRKSFEALRSEQQLPPGIRVAPMDAAMMRKVEATVYPWIGGTWKSPADFEKRGVGVCASTEDEVVSLCYSVFVSHDSYAIDIMTVEKFKRLGLARAVASAFIVECVRRGFHPTWDSYESNFASMRLADALGFKPAREFFVYSWHRQSR